ncbi:uncharacterized protein CELE_C14A11.2 [Caenorhabditis elegans]|uniref:Uncharacterized protein n=1 Tax=Caenorhabditis elegans TaxID=6239 RepID=O02135_CAEEL|nr:Uncharacterized protein CELE_C14A11.2 [Caenorhabditis elegans]CCD63470.2 Uncharacterized protein CELE_C14A11.2 [Caenorhabditis elegans]|eukprot:NP_508487.3 Uncharacterized protein CELE_C14A11.2 [Caenorhabditis elegans]
METSDSQRKRKSSDQEVRETLQKFLLAKKRARTENLNDHGLYGAGIQGPSTSTLSMNRNTGFSARTPLHLDLPHFNHQDLNVRLDMLGTEKHLDKQEIGYRQQFLLQNMSVDDDNEPRKLFTLYDIKDDETSKSALEAKRRLRFTNVHALICPQEKMFLTTACDYFLAIYDELIDYVEAIGELRNKQIIVEHFYYKLFMHTLKMFYYTDKGWRFNLEFDEFFSGYLRKYREPIINQMTRNWNNAKKAAREAAARNAASLTLQIDEQ